MAARSIRWLWLTAAIVAVDRVTKYAVERLTPEGFRVQVVPHFADLVHSVNPGIAFGLFSGSTSRWISFFLVVASAAIIALLISLLAAGYAGDTVSQAGVALIAGGACGNLLDRLLHAGVTDFLELHAGNFVWPAFNVADVAVTIGAAFVIIELLR